jgi:starvation-inducible DNA-binding protein
MPEYSLDISRASKHIAELAHGIAFFSELVRKGVELCAQLGDVDTADILTEISRHADGNLWFVEAHEQAEH